MSPKFVPQHFTFWQMKTMRESGACPKTLIISILGRDCWDVLAEEGRDYAEQNMYPILDAVLSSYSQVPPPDLQRTMIFNLVRQIAKRGSKPYCKLDSEEYRILVRLNLPVVYRSQMFVLFKTGYHLHENTIYLMRADEAVPA